MLEEEKSEGLSTALENIRSSELIEEELLNDLYLIRNKIKFDEFKKNKEWLSERIYEIGVEFTGKNEKIVECILELGLLFNGFFSTWKDLLEKKGFLNTECLKFVEDERIEFKDSKSLELLYFSKKYLKSQKKRIESGLGDKQCDEKVAELKEDIDKDGNTENYMSRPYYLALIMAFISGDTDGLTLNDNLSIFIYAVFSNEKNNFRKFLEACFISEKAILKLSWLFLSDIKAIDFLYFSLRYVSEDIYEALLYKFNHKILCQTFSRAILLESFNDIYYKTYDQSYMFFTFKILDKMMDYNDKQAETILKGMILLNIDTFNCEADQMDEDSKLINGGLKNKEKQGKTQYMIELENKNNIYTLLSSYDPSQTILTKKNRKKLAKLFFTVAKNVDCQYIECMIILSEYIKYLNKNQLLKIVTSRYINLLCKDIKTFKYLVKELSKTNFSEQKLHFVTSVLNNYDHVSMGFLKRLLYLENYFKKLKYQICLIFVDKLQKYFSKFSGVIKDKDIVNIKKTEESISNGFFMYSNNSDYDRSILFPSIGNMDPEKLQTSEKIIYVYLFTVINKFRDNHKLIKYIPNLILLDIEQYIRLVISYEQHDQFLVYSLVVLRRILYTSKKRKSNLEVFKLRSLFLNTLERIFCEFKHRISELSKLYSVSGFNPDMYIFNVSPIKFSTEILLYNLLSYKLRSLSSTSRKSLNNKDLYGIDFAQNSSGNSTGGSNEDALSDRYVYMALNDHKKKFTDYNEELELKKDIEIEEGKISNIDFNIKMPSGIFFLDSVFEMELTRKKTSIYCIFHPFNIFEFQEILTLYGNITVKFIIQNKKVILILKNSDINPNYQTLAEIDISIPKQNQQEEIIEEISDIQIDKSNREIPEKVLEAITVDKRENYPDIQDKYLRSTPNIQNKTNKTHIPIIKLGINFKKDNLTIIINEEETIVKFKNLHRLKIKESFQGILHRLLIYEGAPFNIEYLEDCRKIEFYLKHIKELEKFLIFHNQPGILFNSRHPYHMTTQKYQYKTKNILFSTE